MWAETGASSTTAARGRVLGLAVDDGYGLHITPLGAFSAAPAGIGHLYGQPLETRKDIIELPWRKVSVVAHHAAAGAAETDAQEFLPVRDEKGEVVETHFPDEGDKACGNCLIQVPEGFPGFYTAADLRGKLHGALTHEETAEIGGVIGAIAGGPAEAAVHDDPVGRALYIRGNDLRGHGMALHMEAFVYREIGDTAPAAIHPGVDRPQQRDMPQEERPLNGPVPRAQQGLAAYDPGDDGLLQLRILQHVMRLTDAFFSHPGFAVEEVSRSLKKASHPTVPRPRAEEVRRQ